MHKLVAAFSRYVMGAFPQPYIDQYPPNYVVIKAWLEESFYIKFRQYMT